MPRVNSSPEFGSQDQLTVFLYSSLEQALEGCEVGVGKYHGCSPLESEPMDLSFVTPEKKITVRATDSETSPETYYIKTDAHDPNPFLMPSAGLSAGKDHTVTSIARVIEDGQDSLLAIGVDEAEAGRFLFYINSLNKLELKVVDKDETEQANDKLRKLGGAIVEHDRLVRKAQELAALEAEIAELPDFPLESTSRYTVDLFYGGRLYAINSGQETLTLLHEFGPHTEHESVIFGNFAGNRLQVVDDKLLVVDDELGVGLGAIYDEERERISGLAYLKVSDSSDEIMNRHLLEAASKDS